MFTPQAQKLINTPAQVTTVIVVANPAAVNGQKLINTLAQAADTAKNPPGQALNNPLAQAANMSKNQPLQ